jgi:hypothetical protein
MRSNLPLEKIKNDLLEQVIGITNLLALTIADEGEAHKGDCL